MEGNFIDKRNSLELIKSIYKSKYKSNVDLKYNIAETYYDFKELLNKFNLKTRDKFYKNTNLYYFKQKGDYLYLDKDKTNDREFLENEDYISFFIDDTFLVKKESKIDIIKRIIYQYRKTFSFAAVYIFVVNLILFIFLTSIKNIEVFNWKINIYFLILSLLLSIFIFN